MKHIVFLLIGLAAIMPRTGSAANETPTNQWVLLPVTAPNIVWETGIAYDPDSRWIVRHGGHTIGSYAQDNYTDLFDLQSLRFARSRAPLRPQRRCLVDVAYVDSARRVVTVNGGSSHGSLPQGAPNGDYTSIVQGDPRGPWLYAPPRKWPAEGAANGGRAWPSDGEGDVWEDCRTIGPQWKRAAHSPICYDPVSDTLFGVSGDTLNLFSPRLNRVQQLPLPPAMGARVGHALGIDPAAGKLVLFGGSKDGGWVWARGDRAQNYRQSVMNDTWIFDLATRAWRQAEITTKPPRGAPLVDHLPMPMVYHPPTGTLLMLQSPLDAYEPDNTRWPAAELWSFDARAEEWSRVTLATARDQPAFPGHLAYAAHADALVLWGGGRDGAVEGGGSRGALSRQIRTIRVRIPGRAPVDLAPLIKPAPEPWRPSGLTASVETPQRVTLRWRAGQEPDIAGYKVYRARGAEIAQAKAVCLTGAPVAETRFADSAVDLADGVLRVYYVTAVNRAGIESGPSPLAYTAPDAVTHLDATMATGAAGKRTVTLSWRWPTDVKVAGFHVYHATRHINGTGGAEFRKLWTRRTAAPIAARSYTHELSADEPELQLFYIRAVNVLGQEGFHTDIVSPTDKRFRP